MLPYECERCGRTVNHYGRCECMPGVLTIRYGDETVVVDPMDHPEKFCASQKRASELLEKMSDYPFDVAIR